MKFVCRSRSLLTLLLALASPLAPPVVLAQAFFDTPRSFVVDSACDAHTSTRNQTGPVALEVGRGYVARGENKRPGATHAFIEVDGQTKWVALGCGHYADAPADAGGAGPIVPAADCLPFFDRVDNPEPLPRFGLVDPTPPPPVLTPFGEAVNAACGAPGGRVSREALADLLRAHPEVLARIRTFTRERVFVDRPVPVDTDAYLVDLVDAWSAIHGFDHIFCGEPEVGGGIGGLHFHGRYLQLQEAGLACRLPSNRNNEEVVPGAIYTLGVRMQIDGGSAQQAVKGYGLTLSAEDLVKVITRAFAENPTPSRDSQACLLPVDDDGHQFVTVFVRRNNGIRTFYPDATPDHGGTPPCAAAIALPQTSNAPPVVVVPLPDQTAAAGALTEMAIPAEAFRDPEGEPLRYAVTLADGSPLPDWADFDETRRVLLLLPSAADVGARFDVAVTASDGLATAVSPFELEVVGPAHAPLLVDLDAQLNDQAKPVVRTLPAGLYQTAVIGRAEGGAFDAWRPERSEEAWSNHYTVHTDTFVLTVLATGRHATAEAARAHAPGKVAFVLERDTPVHFYVRTTDDMHPQGGVSLRVSPIE